MDFLSKVNKKLRFGFGILSRWYFVMSAGASLLGTGFGIYFSARILFKSNEGSSFYSIIGLSIMLIGVIITEVAHSKLMKKALNKGSK